MQADVLKKQLYHNGSGEVTGSASRAFSDIWKVYSESDKLSKAAELFGIDVTSLLDNFNLFLYNGQGKQIKGLRKSMKMTQSQFASYIKTPLGTLKK